VKSIFDSVIITLTPLKGKGVKAMQRNQDIRNAIRNAGVPVWLVAEKLGVHENTLYRHLRKKLHTDQKEELLKIVKDIQKFNG
jgi:hypothetical protein